MSPPEVQRQLAGLVQSQMPRCQDSPLHRITFFFSLNAIKKSTQVKFSAFMPCPCSASNCGVSVSIAPAGRAVTAAVLASTSSPGGPGPSPRATNVRVSTTVGLACLRRGRLDC